MGYSAHPDLYSSSARSKCGGLMTLMGQLEPDSAPISKNVRTIQIRQDLPKLGGILGLFQMAIPDLSFQSTNVKTDES